MAIYRFQICAPTRAGESIGLLGSSPELGAWDVKQLVRLHTTGDRYPQWSVEIDIPPLRDLAAYPAIEYKYCRIAADGRLEWEAWGSNRWVPIEETPPSSTLIVEDQRFGEIPPCPYGYVEPPELRSPLPQGDQGLKIVVLGSSVALGCSAWRLRGWAGQLEQALHQRYGHQLVNCSALGSNVSATIDRCSAVAAAEQPDVVIIALSLGNEGLPYCPIHERRAVQRRFENGLLQLIKMTRELGAQPILGGLYPHNDYTPEHYALLLETHRRMLTWGVPVLDWLAAVDNGAGRWRLRHFFDPAHPNGDGHQRMFDAIDLGVFDPGLFDIHAGQTGRIVRTQHAEQPPLETPVYRDEWGFHVLASHAEKTLRLINASPSSYTLNPAWRTLQTALQQQAGLTPGVYIATQPQPGTLPYFAVSPEGRLETTLELPPGTDLTYSAAFNFSLPGRAEVLHYDGHLTLLKEGDRHLRVINESDHAYNIHPMWKTVRNLLKAMPPGVYTDPLYPDLPFRTMMIGEAGLESRIKAPPQSSVRFEYQCPLSDISRVGIIPLGDRCAVRMLLYKLEYDGPAYPFDLTRSLNLGDVADIITSDFHDMWNPDLLYYSADERRIFHRKWTGLSFAHEVEETDDPVHYITPVYERMRDRYTARSQRFWYTLQHCDKALFVRTGGTTRGYVVDLIDKLETVCGGKPFRILLLSPQPSEEFADLPGVVHYNLEFNPDRMYADSDYWKHCTEEMRAILDSLGVSSKNLFWCPPTPPAE